MNNSQKKVLLLQPSKFQAEVWHFALWEQNIFITWKQNYTDKKYLANYFKTLELKPNLLLIDLKIEDAYEICQCFRQHHPESKIILTTDIQNEYSLAIRRWAVRQGLDELLINFQKKHGVGESRYDFLIFILYSS